MAGFALPGGPPSGSAVLKALTIFSGNANRELAQAICRYVETPLGRAEVTRFADGEVYVEINENVRGVNCFVVQPTCAPANDNLMELLVMIDALKRASAGSIIAVLPYFGYARQDRKVRPRTPISAKLVANLIAAAGADRVLSGPAIQRIDDSPLTEVCITDTVPLSELGRQCKKIKVLSVARLLGEAVKRIHHGDSISSLFI